MLINIFNTINYTYLTERCNSFVYLYYQ